VVDGSSTEEGFFTAAMREETKKLKLTLIEIPRDGAGHLNWITKLDGAALSGKSRSTKPPLDLTLTVLDI